MGHISNKNIGSQEETHTLTTIGAAETDSAQARRSLTSIQTLTGNYCVGAEYKKLHIFSGIQTVPEREEEYETWMEQAVQAVEEPAKTVSSLLFQFQQIYQKRYERLSKCIRRLNKLLCQIVERKGMDLTEVWRSNFHEVLYSQTQSGIK
ncbi:hypothetical protein E2320_019820 [Naja naja]|nr:hypothetical protein E2320_019820 [Naja naja]